MKFKMLNFNMFFEYIITSYKTEVPHHLLSTTELQPVRSSKVFAVCC